MSTLRQVFKKSKNILKPESKAKLNAPQKKGICLRVYTQSPKKPNSANRSVAKIRLSRGQVIIASIKGEGHNLQEHSLVLVQGGRSKDLPAVRHKVVRGSQDLACVVSRQRARSKYGTSKKKN